MHLNGKVSVTFKNKQYQWIGLLSKKNNFGILKLYLRFYADFSIVKQHDDFRIVTFFSKALYNYFLNLFSFSTALMEIKVLILGTYFIQQVKNET